MSHTRPLFFTVTGEDFRRSIAASKTQPNPVADDLKRPIVSLLLRQNAEVRTQLTTVEERLLKAVNASCSCGGNPAEDPLACPACMVWHRFTSSSVTPTPVLP
jgi:hypothetical protein